MVCDKCEEINVTERTKETGRAKNKSFQKIYIYITHGKKVCKKFFKPACAVLSMSF